MSQSQLLNMGNQVGLGLSIAQPGGSLVNAYKANCNPELLVGATAPSISIAITWEEHGA